MFDFLADLPSKLANTGYFIDPLMTQVVFLAANSTNLCSWKGQPDPASSTADLGGCGRRHARRTAAVLSRSQR